VLDDFQQGVAQFCVGCGWQFAAQEGAHQHAEGYLAHRHHQVKRRAVWCTPPLQLLINGRYHEFAKASKTPAMELRPQQA
jgi:hypothetical protein